jgi:cbb3-type cytochrome oxidase maturation protein
MGTLGFLIVLSLLLGLGAWLAFLWSVRSGQYDDPEGPKYRMLDDDEPGARAPPEERREHPPKVDR